jgi:alkyl hydroperoxide reductase subunit F
MYDLVIAGGGPAGLTATVYVARKGTNLLLLTHDIGGQVLWTMGIENYMGFQFVGGSELIGKFEDQVKQFPIDIKTEQRTKTISIADGGFLLVTEAGDKYQARAVIVATGKRPRMLGVPGEERLRGRGVTYCSVCDGPVFTGEKVAVIGGGNSALEAADDMAKIAEHVDLVSITPLTGDEVLIDKVESATNVTKFPEHQGSQESGTEEP